MAAKSLVVVGHGMVGHRFVEALRPRDTESTWKVSSSPRRRRRHTTAWGSRPTSARGTAAHSPSPATRMPVTTSSTCGSARARPSIDRDARTVTTAAATSSRYDALVLATGSYPFVPPVPGHDSTGCFVYRTLDDLDGIRAAAEAADPRRRPGVVVGGGLLGLEAANALRLLGLTPHVVEFAPRLMPLQVDEGGGAVLERLVSEPRRAGAHRRRHAVDRPRRTTAACAVELSDGTALLTDLVVFSAGVRPADPLARAAGLDVGERGGVVTDAACRTATRTSGPSARSPRSRGAATASSRRATRWPRSSPTGCSAARRPSPAPTCRPSSSCSASTSPASATRWARTAGRARDRATPTRRRAPTPRSWSPTTRRPCSAASSSATRPPTRRCGRWSAARCPATRPR